jgi:anti-anti-sigma factor
VASATATLAGGVFEVEQAEDTLIVVPAPGLDELAQQRLEAGTGEVLEALRGSPARNILLDFGRTDAFGSAALGLLLRLGGAARRRAGHLAFCNVSAAEQEILRVTSLDRLWPVYPSRAEALAAVKA